jgi:hypothetical protein
MPNAPMGARQRESVFSMKGARIVVLGIALAAGGTAAYLVRGDDPPPPAPPPVVQVDSDDVLVAGTDIGVGQQAGSLPPRRMMNLP